MTFRAVNDRLLVEEVPESDLSILSSGLYVSEKVAQTWAVVVSVGEGRFNADGSRAPMPAKVGDRVLLTKPVGLPVMIRGKRYLAVRDTDIIAVIDGGP